MLNKEQLRELLHKDGLTKKDQTLIILAVDSQTPKSISMLRELAIYSGFPDGKKWNFSQYLANAKGLAINIGDGWVLNSQGKKYLLEQGFINSKPTHIANVYTDLRNHVAKIQDVDTRDFLEEAIKCLEVDLYRAAIVLSWIGAVSVLHKYLISKPQDLANFNTEAQRRYQNKKDQWKIAKTPDDLGRMNEAEFLEVLETISVIGKNVKQQLKQALDLRNGCGHPNTLKISQNAVGNHLEILIQNVFSVFV